MSWAILRMMLASLLSLSLAELRVCTVLPTLFTSSLSPPAVSVVDPALTTVRCPSNTSSATLVNRFSACAPVRSAPDGASVDESVRLCRCLCWLRACGLLPVLRPTPAPAPAPVLVPVPVPVPVPVRTAATCLLTLRFSALAAASPAPVLLPSPRPCCRCCCCCASGLSLLFCGAAVAESASCWLSSKGSLATALALSWRREVLEGAGTSERRGRRTACVSTMSCRTQGRVVSGV